MEGEGVWLGVGVCVGDCEDVAVREGEADRLAVVVGVGEGESVPVTDGVAEGAAPVDGDGESVPVAVAPVPPPEGTSDVVAVLVVEGVAEMERVAVVEIVGDDVEPVEMDGVGVPDDVGVAEGAVEADGAWQTPPVGGTPASEPDGAKASVLEVTRTAPADDAFLTVMA